MYLFLQRPINDPCTTLPILGYVIHITVVFMDGSQDNYTSRFINNTEGGSMDIFNFSFRQLFDESLMPNSIYVLTIFPTDRLGKLPTLYSYILACLFMSWYCMLQIVQVGKVCGFRGSIGDYKTFPVK